MREILSTTGSKDRAHSLGPLLATNMLASGLTARKMVKEPCFGQTEISAHASG
jgi:hypothetical protein